MATIYVLLPVAALFFLSFHQNGSSMTLFAKVGAYATTLSLPEREEEEEEEEDGVRRTRRGDF